MEGVNLQDTSADSTGGDHTDLIGDETDAVAYWYVDDTSLYFRLRLADTPYEVPLLNQFHGNILWGILIDTDSSDTFDFLLGVSGFSGEIGIYLPINQLGIPFPKSLHNVGNVIPRGNQASGAVRVVDPGAGDHYFLDLQISLPNVDADMSISSTTEFRIAPVVVDVSTSAPLDDPAVILDLAESTCDHIVNPSCETLANVLSASMVFDADGDGLLSFLEDMLGTSDEDQDSDDDGLGDYAEVMGGPCTIDGAGDICTSDPAFWDTDFDGIYDGTEMQVPFPAPLSDTNTNAICPDAVDATRNCYRADEDPTEGTDPRDSDSDSDGIADGYEDRDHDGAYEIQNCETDPQVVNVIGSDDIPDSLDDNPSDDNDNDGIPDNEEWIHSTSTPPDPDPGPEDPGVKFCTDTDGDGIYDINDDDSDNDGILDVEERQCSTDAIEVWSGPGDPDPFDADGDGLRNYRDPTSDSDMFGDGYYGNVEDSDDPDEDGLCNLLDEDSDGDSIADRYEQADEIDGVGEPDDDEVSHYLDLDSDGDGIPDETENLGGSTDAPPIDTDGDGTPDYLDRDSDNDGILDQEEGFGDPDGDGLPNFRDLDSDGDAFLDSDEAGFDDDCDGVPEYLDTERGGKCPRYAGRGGLCVSVEGPMTSLGLLAMLFVAFKRRRFK